MKTRRCWVSWGVLLLLLIGIISLQIAIAPQYFNQDTSRMPSASLTLETNEDITLSGSITVSDGDTLEYINKTIYYDSSETPIFTVYGTLRLINCKIILLRDPVDFISASQAEIFLENVTFINPSGNSSSIFIISNSYLYVNHATFSGFHGGSISDSDDVYISDMYANITGQLNFNGCKNLTIANSRIDLFGNNPVRLLEIASTDGVTLINNTIRIPVEAVEEHSAWLEGISMNTDTNVIVRGNTVINGGKTLVSYGSSNILIVNNTFMNEKLVEGTELQIDSTSKDIIIVNNSFYGLWEAIEVYAHKNITIIGNIIVQSDVGIKVEPSTSSEITEVYVFDNTLVNSSFLIFYCNGLIVKNNTIENWDVWIDNSNNVTLQQNLLRNVTVHVENSKDIKIINNTIYVFEGKDWLSIENSTVTEKDNAIVTLPSSGGDQSGEENQEENESQESQEQIQISIPLVMMFAGILGIMVCLAIIVVLKQRKKISTEV